MSERICRNCRYARRSLIDAILCFGWRFAKCIHPSSNIPTAESRVTGAPYFSYCTTQRSSVAKSRCGDAGQHFEARP